MSIKQALKDHGLFIAAAAVLVVAFFASDAHANPLDEGCPTFSAGTYPVATQQSQVQYKCMKRYGVAYDPVQKIPVYVATVVTKEQMGGDVVRGNHFYVDKFFSSSKPSDYVGTPYDKGHLAEAELFTTDEEAMAESFCMCNMHPQLANFNRGIWKSLETYSHKLAVSSGLIYIISGTVYDKTSPTIGKGAAVPSASWKIIYIPSTKTTEAYLIPNVEHQHEQFKKYKVTVQQISIATGIKFHVGE